jgi:hypothetical protein
MKVLLFLIINSARNFFVRLVLVQNPIALISGPEKPYTVLNELAF